MQIQYQEIKLYWALPEIKRHAKKNIWGLPLVNTEDARKFMSLQIVAVNNSL